MLPYAFEATAAGIAGGALAVGALATLHQFAIPRIAPDLAITTATSQEIGIIIAAIVALGGVLGLVGSALSSLRLRMA